MTTKTIVTVTCDICNEAIDVTQQYVSAGVYGYEFHTACLERVDGTFIGFLSDEVQLVDAHANGQIKWDNAQRFYWNKKVRNA